MAQSKAWLLELGDDHRAAVGNQYMVEYLATNETEIMPVPLAPDYSPGVMVWREQIIPVIDLVRLLNPGYEYCGDISGIMILAYQDAPGAPLKHGALALRAAPENIMVNGDTACAIPATPRVWRELAIACFSNQDEAIPILNAQRVFSSGIRSIYQDSLTVADEQGTPETETESLNQIDASPDDLGSTPDHGKPRGTSIQKLLDTVDAVINKHSQNNRMQFHDHDIVDQASDEMQEDKYQREDIPDAVVENSTEESVPSHSEGVSVQTSDAQQMTNPEAGQPNPPDLIESSHADSVFEDRSTLEKNEDPATLEIQSETIPGEKPLVSRLQRFRNKYGPGRRKISGTHRRFGQRRG